MPYFALQPRYYVYIDTVGDPLNNGYVYIGDANLDPELYPAKVSWDDSGLYPVEFPVRTRDGYLMRGEYPGQLFINIEDNEEFSILILEEDGTEVFSSATGLAGYWPSDTGGDADTLGGQLPSYYATDSLVVHLAGAETITGQKTFSAEYTYLNKIILSSNLQTSETDIQLDGNANIAATAGLYFFCDSNNDSTNSGFYFRADAAFGVGTQLFEVLENGDVKIFDGLLRAFTTGTTSLICQSFGTGTSIPINLQSAENTVTIRNIDETINNGYTSIVFSRSTTGVDSDGLIALMSSTPGNASFNFFLDNSNSGTEVFVINNDGTATLGGDAVYTAGTNPSLGAGNGVSGSIDTTATQTITVTNGIITAIA